MVRSASGHPERAGRHGVGARLAARRRLLALAAVAVLGACSGDGIYSGPVEPGPGPGPTPPPTGSARGLLVEIPNGGLLADLAVDAAGGRVFLSNRDAHRVEVFELDGLAFREPVPVGSQPWGMALNLAGDTLIVANSGGTNFSFVDLATLSENPAARFDIPRVVLYEYGEEVDTATNAAQIKLNYYSYADRPRHVAQDAQRRLVYSAVSTAVAPIGTLRVAEMKSGWATWDARLLFADGSVASNPNGENRAVTASENFNAVANLDSMTLVWRDVDGVRLLTDRVVMFDHRPGTRPGDAAHLIRSDSLPFFAAFQQMRARGSDAIVYPGHQWNIPESSRVSDTTFVAASGDHRWIAVGENAGRVLLWGAGAPGKDGALARVEDVHDITNNAGDHILGIDLNANGTLGVARGAQGTYFFGPDLRLQGQTSAAAAGARGAGFLPGGTTNRGYAVEPTGNRGVRIIETTHYRVVAELPVAETVTGPFRVAPPRPGVDACPADLTSADAGCVVATVYGVTEGRRLLVLDLERGDFIP